MYTNNKYGKMEMKIFDCIIKCESNEKYNQTPA